jgi:hypothetical protein
MATHTRKKSADLGSGDNFDLSSSSACFEEFSFEDALEDSPEIRERLKASATCSENAALLMKSFIKKAVALKDQLEKINSARDSMLKGNPSQ